jgi:hypothetical protein
MRSLPSARQQVQFLLATHERCLTASKGKTARIWMTPPVASNIIATACKMLRDRDATDLSIHYGIEVKDPICTGDEPAPDPSRIIGR